MSKHTDRHQHLIHQLFREVCYLTALNGWQSFDLHSNGWMENLNSKLFFFSLFIKLTVAKRSKRVHDFLISSSNNNFAIIITIIIVHSTQWATNSLQMDIFHLQESPKTWSSTAGRNWNWYAMNNDVLYFEWRRWVSNFCTLTWNNYMESAHGMGPSRHRLTWSPQSPTIHLFDVFPKPAIMPPFPQQQTLFAMCTVCSLYANFRIKIMFFGATENTEHTNIAR